MPETFVRFTVPGPFVAQFEALAKSHAILISESQPLDNSSEPLNAPITGADIAEAAKVITAVVTAGSGLIKFAQQVADMMRNSGRSVVVRDAKNKKLSALGDNSTSENIERELKDV